MPIQQFRQCSNPDILKDFLVPDMLTPGQTIFDTVEFQCYEATENDGTESNRDY